MKFKFPKYLKYLKCKEGESRGVYESGLCPTRTQPDIIEWGRFRLATNLPKVSDQPGRVVSVFGCESVGFGFFDSPIFGQYPVRSTRVGRDSFGSNSNLAKLESGLPEFWLSLSKSGLVCQNLAYLSKEEARSWSNFS